MWTHQYISLDFVSISMIGHIQHVSRSPMKNQHNILNIAIDITYLAQKHYRLNSKFIDTNDVVSVHHTHLKY